MSSVDQNRGLSLVRPKVPPRLDPDFRPAVLANRSFRAAVEKSGGVVPLLIALERADGSVSRHDTIIAPAGHPAAGGNLTYVERLLKFLLWSRGGYRIYMTGPEELARELQRHYAESPTGKFDAQIMGDKIYEKPFEVRRVAPEQVPPAREITAPLGKHLEGCRIGFDLGASDRKVAAVKDGETIFSEETPWDPRNQSDPQ